MLGIACKWECPSCGNMINTHSPFWNKDLRKKVAEPTKCGCGKKSNFRLVGFAPCQYEGYKIVETMEVIENSNH